jgi:MFS family permease
MYSSSLLAYFLLAAFGDYFGRKRIIQLGLALTIGGVLGCIFSFNMILAAVGMLVSCWGCEWIYTIGLMFIT